MDRFQNTKALILRIPAPLLCYWMGKAELISTGKNQINEWKLEEEYMSNPKKHHYVPQFLLKEFLPSGKDQLFVYDTKEKAIRSQKPREVACESSLYNIIANGKIDKQLEEKFGQIESNSVEVIEKFKQRIQLSTQERETLARFIALTRIRTPAFLNALAKIEVNFRELGRFKENQEIDFTNESTKEISRDAVLKHPFFWWYWEFLEKKILTMKWSLFESPYGRAFFTSDNPLCSILKDSELTQNGISIVHEFDDASLRLFLPLSKNYAWLGHMEDGRENYYMANEWMSMFERNTILWANRYLYASTKDEAILDHALEYQNVYPYDFSPSIKPHGYIEQEVQIKRVT